MIILGLDPGSRMTGFGVIQRQGSRCVHIENGTLYVEDAEKNYPKRLAHLFRCVEDIINRFDVQHVVVENIFYHKNVKSTQKLGEVRGVLMACASLKGKEVFEYSALQVKQAVTGFGKADKVQVQMMVKTLLGLKDIPEENAADALAIALCHGHQNHLTQSIAVQGAIENKARKDIKELLKKASFYR